MNKLLLCFLLLTSQAFAADKTFSGSSEASAVVINGNSNNETYSLKTENTYTVTEYDLAKVFGKYLRTVATGTESAKAWDAGLRYERIFTKDQFSGYVQQKAEHDPYNGVFIQRDTSDIGAQYTITKSDAFTWLAELGYSYASTYVATELDKNTGSYIRGFTSAEYKISTTASTKAWVEHFAPLKSSDKSRSNAELSLVVSMTEMFSLKTAYLINHDEAAISPLKKDSSSWTTALVAKY